MGFFEMVGEAVQRIDGWANVITGIGGSLRKTNFSFQRDVTIPDQILEDIYNGNDYAANIIDAYPDYSLREGVNITTGDSAVDEAMSAKFDDLLARESFVKAYKWGRLYGGGAIFLGADDGVKDLRIPLNLNAVQSIEFLTVLEKRDMQPQDYEKNPRSPHFGMPSTYRFTRNGGGGGIDNATVHRSRLIMFDGVLTTERKRNELNGWSLSVIQRIYNRLQQFEGTNEAVAELVQSSSIGVIKLKELMKMVAADKDDRLKKRLDALDAGRSIAKSILLDADGETYEKIETGALSGLADIMDRSFSLLAGSARIPVTVLMRKSPAGLTATGDSDIRQFYDDIRADQTHNLRPKFQRLARVIFRSKSGPTGGVEPEKWKVVFPSLWQLTDAEKAGLRKAVADTDNIYITAQVVTPEEVATSRFPEGGWSMETNIELDAREIGLTPVDGTQPANDTVPAAPVSVAEQAMNGAQVTSLQGIVTAAAANQLPVGTAREIIGAAFPELNLERIERMLAPIAGQAGAVSQLADANTKLAAVTKSHASLKSTLKRLIAKYGHAGSVVGITGSGAGVSDEELDAAVAEVEGAEAADAGGAPTAAGAAE